MAKLIGIGVGPGAEDLLTLRALRYLREADHIFVPANRKKTRAYDVIRDWVDETKVEFLSFPMGKVTEAHYQEAFTRIQTATGEGEMSVLLTLGDGTVYATLMEVIRAGEGHGMEVEVVPGITAFSAAINGIAEALVTKGESFLLVDRPEALGEAASVDAVAILKTTDAARTFQQLSVKGFYPLYFENIETDGWLIASELDKVAERKAYMSLIIGRRTPWNMEAISRRIGARIRIL